MTATLFEWDDAKDESNYAKHGVDFATATDVFADAFAIERMDPRSPTYGEERILITGMGGGAVLTVVFTERGDSLRIISARRANRRERDEYYAQNSQD